MATRSATPDARLQAQKYLRHAQNQHFDESHERFQTRPVISSLVPLLQLIERPRGNAYVFDLVEVKSGRPVVPPAGTLPMSAGSQELLGLASAVSAFGLRALAVDIADLSGRDVGEEGDDLAAELLSFVHEGLPDRAARALAQRPNYFVETVRLEDPKTHAVVTCNRRGIVSIQGPAIEHEDALIAAVLGGLERTFDR